MNALEKQILIGLGVALIVRKIATSTQGDPVFTSMPGDPTQSSQIWAGAGADPFGMSYTVVGKAARGGL